MSVESTVRKLLPYTSAGLALALLYVCWTFFSRWNDNSAIDRSAAAAKAKAEAKAKADAEAKAKAASPKAPPTLAAPS